MIGQTTLGWGLVMNFVIPDGELLRFAEDDVPYGDLTTGGLGIGDIAGVATLTAAADMIACCVEEATRLFELHGCMATPSMGSGARVTAGTVLLRAQGRATDLHRTAKVAQTLMEMTSGIATRAAAIVQAARAENPAIAVACTRKHMPGMKRVALKAIMAGGATPHRLGLSDSILIFAEHRAFLDVSLDEAIRQLRVHAPERRVAIEADTEAEALAYAQAGADIVQVDKAPPEVIARIAAVFRALPRPPLLAATGGINETNARAYAAAGADVLVTSAPYTAPPRDVKVRMSRAASGERP